MTRLLQSPPLSTRYHHLVRSDSRVPSMLNPLGLAARRVVQGTRRRERGHGHSVLTSVHANVHANASFPFRDPRRKPPSSVPVPTLLDVQCPVLNADRYSLPVLVCDSVEPCWGTSGVYGGQEPTARTALSTAFALAGAVGSADPSSGPALAHAHGKQRDHTIYRKPNPRDPTEIWVIEKTILYSADGSIYAFVTRLIAILHPDQQQERSSEEKGKEK